MINKRLINTVDESKKYIAGNVIFQWCSLAANIAMMFSISRLLAGVYLKTADTEALLTTVITVAAALIIRFVCTTLASRMAYFSSKAVKKTLRELIYKKLLRLGVSYKERVQTSEVVQVAVEGGRSVGNLLRSLSSSIFLCDGSAAYAVCGAVLYQCTIRSSSVSMCSNDPHCYCCSTNMGEKASVKVLGAVHVFRRYFFRKSARFDDAENISGRCF